MASRIEPVTGDAVKLVACHSAVSGGKQGGQFNFGETRHRNPIILEYRTIRLFLPVIRDSLSASCLTRSNTNNAWK